MANINWGLEPQSKKNNVLRMPGPKFMYNVLIEMFFSYLNTIIHYN